LSAAYVDSSVVLAHVFRQHEREATRAYGFARVHSAELLVAEVLSAVARERLRLDEVLLDGVQFVTPTRSLRPEIERVLAAGYVRGADCLHLATALYLTPDPAELTFLTLDERQRAVAVALGFAV
jgi:predicted nucleic acid-binding protein